MNRYDEIGKHDVPAMINYILKQTGYQKLSYVGHSMGCAVFFIAMITHPELNSKIDVMMAMAPGVAVANSKSVLFFAAAPILKEMQVTRTKNSFVKFTAEINTKT